MFQLPFSFQFFPSCIILALILFSVPGESFNSFLVASKIKNALKGEKQCSFQFFPSCIGGVYDDDRVLHFQFFPSCILKVMPFPFFATKCLSILSQLHPDAERQSVPAEYKSSFQFFPSCIEKVSGNKCVLISTTFNSFLVASKYPTAEGKHALPCLSILSQLHQSIEETRKTIVPYNMYTFNSFLVASGCPRDPEARSSPIFQFFPSCILSDASDKPGNVQDSFNSFLVASLEEGQQCVSKCNFQFFPSCISQVWNYTPPVSGVFFQFFPSCIYSMMGMSPCRGRVPFNSFLVASGVQDLHQLSLEH